VKLWLDDMRPCPDKTWTHCVSARGAMIAMAECSEGSEVFEQASLDHDLGPGDGDGMEVVEWMVKARLWPLLKPTVHSANWHAAKNMKALIDRAGPYRDGQRTFISEEPQVHPGAGYFDNSIGTHMICPDVACCRCTCPGCMYEWRAAGKPTETDCEIHIK